MLLLKGKVPYYKHNNKKLLVKKWNQQLLANQNPELTNAKNRHEDNSKNFLSICTIIYLRGIGVGCKCPLCHLP